MACALAFLLWTGLAHAELTIDWSTVNSGGGTSTGSQLSLSGTVGQPDAGTTRSETFVISGGYWPADYIDRIFQDRFEVVCRGFTPIGLRARA